MDFAKNLLQKYGWREGDGLGKRNSGIVKPLKASLKFDNAGFGHDKAEEFNNHWWNNVYNTAANNISIGKIGNNVTIGTNGQSSVEITTKQFSTKKLKERSKASGYGSFLKSVTLTDKGVIDNPDATKLESIQNNLNNFKTLRDEDLFKACNGRTAHKGARHGLKLSGKLARISEQDNLLAEKLLKTDSNGREAPNEIFKEWISVVSSKKKAKKIKKQAIKEKQLAKLSWKSDWPTDSENNEIEENPPYADKVFKKKYSVKIVINGKKKRKNMELSNGYECLSNETDSILGIKDDSKSIKKKSKKKAKQFKDLPTYDNVQSKSQISVPVSELNPANRIEGSDSDSDEKIRSLIFTNDYAKVSKKKRKRIRAVDMELSKAFSSLQTTESPNQKGDIFDINVASKNIKKKSKKKKKSNCFTVPPPVNGSVDSPKSEHDSNAEFAIKSNSTIYTIGDYIKKKHESARKTKEFGKCLKEQFERERVNAEEKLISLKLL